MAVNLAYYITLVIRFYVAHSLPKMWLPYFEAFWTFAPYYTVMCIVVFLICKLYNSVWRYVGINDLHRIMIASLITSALNIICSIILVKRMPISYYIIGALVQFILICISRFGYRIYLMEVDKLGKKKMTISMNVMIVGIGETAQIVRRRIDNDRTNVAQPVCIFSTKDNRKNIVFNGLPLLTELDKLADYIDQYKVDCVALADTDLSDEETSIIKGVCDEKQVEIQDFSEYFSKDVDSKMLISLLNSTIGSVEVIINGKTVQYVSGEEALAELTGGYSITSISANNSRVVITLSDSKKVICSPKDDWVKSTGNVDSSEISFF